MAVSRRRWFQAAALAGGSGVLPAQQPPPALPLTEERLRLLAPVLARRRAQLQSLRDFVIDDRVGPVPGVLDGGE